MELLYGKDIKKLNQMNEAIFILEREKKLLEDCIKEWHNHSHPEAFKQRNKKLKEINNALEILKNENNN